MQNLDVQKGRALVTDDFEIPSEVDEFWTKLRAKVIPGVKKQPAVTVEARLSEPPEIRRQIEQQARAELIKAGADEKATTVTVLSAYKQGYSWLYDVVRPALDGQGGRSDHDQVRRDRPAGRVEAAGHVRADALAARALSDRRDPRVAS